jgi:hypothetical protein
MAKGWAVFWLGRIVPASTFFKGLAKHRSFAQVLELRLAVRRRKGHPKESRRWRALRRSDVDFSAEEKILF